MKEQEGPVGAEASGAQRVKNVSSSSREYSEVRGLWVGLAGELLSGTLSWTGTPLESSGITAVG